MHHSAFIFKTNWFTKSNLHERQTSNKLHQRLHNIQCVTAILILSKYKAQTLKTYPTDKTRQILFCNYFMHPGIPLPTYRLSSCSSVVRALVCEPSGPGSIACIFCSKLAITIMFSCSTFLQRGKECRSKPENNVVITQN